MSDKKIMRPEGQYHRWQSVLAAEGQTIDLEADAVKATAFPNEKEPSEEFLRSMAAANKEPLDEEEPTEEKLDLMQTAEKLRGLRELRGGTEDRELAYNYSSLKDVLDRAYAQAAVGKGKERHAQGQPFEEQPMQTISKLIGSSDGMRYQAIKKIQEAGRMGEQERRTAELLGAINYIAGIIIFEEKSDG